jgi:ATP-dependent RNA helicase HelY
VFDATTAELIREAPALSGVDPQTLPQELTRIYSDLVVLRLKGTALADEQDQLQILQRLKRIADIYEAAVDTGTEGDARRAAAFVAATAHQLLGRVLVPGYESGQPLLEPDAIPPSIAAPLLFLVAEQNADAREAAQPLGGIRIETLLRSAVIESVFDLASERFESILERATRLQHARVNVDGVWITSAADALYGLCWSGIVQLVSHLLGQPFPQLEFLRFDTPQQAFEQVITLATDDLTLEIAGPNLVSTFAGPRHLARLLRHLADDLFSAGILGVAPPGGADQQFWDRWVRHRAKTKPVLWPNHRAALAEGILETGRSAVLVLPTGAGKTTLSELKIASTLARGKKVLFLVPTLALVDQLRDELEETFPKSLGGMQVQVSADGDLTGLIVGPELQTIEVMTPERCLALLSHAADAIEAVGLLVFDECHLLSPMGGGKRSLDAMLCLLHALKRAPDADLLLLSAMLTNATEFAEWIQESTGRPCTAYQNPWKPSRQARGVVVYRSQDLRNIAISREMIPYGLFGLHQHWNPQSAVDLRLVSLSNETVTLARSARGWATPNANAVANALAMQASRAGLKTIVFVQQADYAPTNAKKIADALDASSALTAPEGLLWMAVQAEMGGAEFSFVQPDKQAQPHNGDMIPQERRLVESMFKRDDGSSVIVATPTLAQGMNLPAQLAILAGDKRQDETGRSSLEAHEILNAAGRAGRAGHLANGIVLLIPEPVAAFTAAGNPEPDAVSKLRQLLPPNDQCVPMDDPLTTILDQIQAGNLDDATVRYFSSRVRAGESSDDAVDKAVLMVSRSFAAFKARQARQEASFNQKLEALRAVLADNVASPEIVTIAASTGLSNEPLLAAQAIFTANPAVIPTSVVAWIDWIVAFFAADEDSYMSLLGDDADIVNYVVRGKKSGGPPTAAEFTLLKAGLNAWVTGRSFHEIELALGVAANNVKRCQRARDLVLKLANRSLYLIASSLVEVAKLVLAAQGVNPPQPAVLEILAVAIRKGLDTPDKIAFAYRRPNLRSRVLIHRSFTELLGAPGDTAGLDYAAVLMHTTARIAFAVAD